jgi:hypothetical protein
MLHLLGPQVAVFGSGPGLHRLVSTLISSAMWNGIFTKYSFL